MCQPIEWTAEDRIRVASKMLSLIQLDIPVGRYGRQGRPNITSVMHVLHAPPELLNRFKHDLERTLGTSDLTG